MTFVIRPAVAADLPGIGAVDLAAARSSSADAPRFAESVRVAIADPARLVLVAETPGDNGMDGGSAVVGWAKTHYWDYGDGQAPAGHYLGGVTVLPDFRRRGLATELTAGRLDWIWARAESAWYVVNARNEASLALHRAWGFREVARGPAFHTVTFDGGEGVLLTAARPRA
ncbi:ribosomal protein S18 acetylase RimI-like enzyme [Paenarthrobacter nitroguajacolicus]|uniref:GNAT family N-acetyltransferase n=1 Tax=Paenarthrobacter TaxID=1742992 RepID=UPI002864F871|nr:GNAT family N-acetyltransferase [Paenarthrobacter nitroguajacolicus]MDR6988510.1 ribosomal protein S18 acetylase RimI-like enzyme [Paenarthrobacter nitroguajacolicus]